MKNNINKCIRIKAWPGDKVTFHFYLAICWNIFRVLNTSPTPSFFKCTS